MKARLLFADRDLDLEATLPVNAEDLVQDLELGTVLDAMALGDRFLRQVALRVILQSLTDPEAIRYRQQVLEDCLREPAVVRELYDIVVETLEGSRRLRFGLYPGASPRTILYVSVKMLGHLVQHLRRIRRIADERSASLSSPGFLRFFAMIRAELDDDYFRTIAGQLAELEFRDGVVTSAELGRGNKGARYVLRRTPGRPGWARRLIARRRSSAYGFNVDPRDEAGTRTLADIQSLAMNQVANALAQSADHILGFFSSLQAELAFYVGCLNLYEGLVRKGEPTCVPTVLPEGERRLLARGLYDASLSLHLEGRAVGNDLDAGGRALIVITGANQGGKSTLLRSLGSAQLLMQCGMRVPAESFTAETCDGIFTHFKREEDPAMESGKLDEELRRMSGIVDSVRPSSFLLCNESFASTNEREGSEIAREVVGAFLEAGLRIAFVTHLFELADSLRATEGDRGLFLRAERLPDGRRTFRVVPGLPRSTSHGRDVFERVFGPASAPSTLLPAHAVGTDTQEARG
jgi:hypothetical protein